MNIQKSVEQGILRAVGKIGMCAVAGIALAAATPKIINAGEKAYNDVKDRIETEQAIKAEGIQAQSYAEAKMKLDSIRFDRTCNEVGMPVPKKPSRDASIQEQMNYDLQVMDIYLKAQNKQYDKILQSLKSMKE